MPHDMTARLARRVKLKDAHIITRMADIAEGLTDVIKLGRGDPDLDTPPHIVAAGQQALGEGPRITRTPSASPRCGRRSPTTSAPMVAPTTRPRTSW
jgi:aminotransferase